VSLTMNPDGLEKKNCPRFARISTPDHAIYYLVVIPTLSHLTRMVAHWFKLPDRHFEPTLNVELNFISNQKNKENHSSVHFSLYILKLLPADAYQNTVANVV